MNNLNNNLKKEIERLKEENCHLTKQVEKLKLENNRLKNINDKSINQILEEVI